MMDFLQLLELPKPSFGGFVFTIWFIGFVGGYCFGRAHAAWKTLNNFIKANS